MPKGVMQAPQGIEAGGKAQEPSRGALEETLKGGIGPQHPRRVRQSQKIIQRMRRRRRKATAMLVEETMDFVTDREVFDRVHTAAASETAGTSDLEAPQGTPPIA